MLALPGRLQQQTMLLVTPLLHHSPMHQLHRVFCRPGWRGRALPIECFGVGAKFTDVTSLYTIAWAFKLGRGKQWATKYVFSCIPKAACVSAHGINTLDEI